MTSCPGVKREADLVRLVRGDARAVPPLAAHDRRLQPLDLPRGVLGVEQQEVVPGVGQDRHVDVGCPGRLNDGSTYLMESLMAFIWYRCLPK
jgi:hypothetical protein